MRFTHCARDGSKRRNKAIAPYGPEEEMNLQSRFSIWVNQTRCRVALSPLPGGERSDRACAIRVRGKPANNRLRSLLTRNVRAMRAHSDLSPPGRGEKHSLNVIGKCSKRRWVTRPRRSRDACKRLFISIFHWSTRLSDRPAVPAVPPFRHGPELDVCLIALLVSC